MKRCYQIRKKAQENMLAFWQAFLFQNKLSWIRRTIISALITIFGFLVTVLLYYETNTYFSSIIILVIVLITLCNSLLSSLFFILVLDLSADYFLIPPTGSILESPKSIEQFIIFISIGIVTSLLMSTLRKSYILTSTAKQEAEKAIHARELLIAIISHELKNPLTTIGSSIQLVKKTTPALENLPMIKKFIESINSSVSRMNRLVSDLLDLSNLDAGRITLKTTQVEITELLNSIIETFAPIAEAKSLKMTYYLSPTCPQEILCDHDRILQALSNIVGNAVKFTQKGSITIEVKSTENEILFLVHDTGPGIPKSYIPNLFDRYWQARKTAHLGTGLGLSISKGIAEAHGGKIWVESKEGAGSTFFLILPHFSHRLDKNLTKKTAA